MTKSQIIQKFLEIAQGELGTREVNDNRGVKVGQYQAATTLGGTGWPWCSAYECWCLKETEKALGIKIPWTFSASCDVIWADGRSRGLIRSSPQPGDIFIVKAKRSGGYSAADGIHTGIVTAVNGGKISTLEGNTNDDGGREGVAVMAHQRPVNDRLAFIRWIDGVTFKEEPVEKPWRVVAGGKDLAAALVNGTNYVPARDFGTALGLVSSWDAENGQVVLSGSPVESQPRLIDGRAYFPIRVLAEHVGKLVKADAMARMVTIG